MKLENPRKWRYTWEAQSHIPILKLFLFTPDINPILHCIDLNVNLKFEKSLLELTWEEQKSPVSLVVPLPRVLVDLESPVNFRPLNDHIEVKIALLLSVDHPIVSSFISELNSEDDSYGSLSLEPLSMDSDFKSLSSKGNLDFCCRNCGFKLTKTPIRCLVDLPSVNWTDVADNWFGSCCCSFGGISEKLVAKYVKSYECAEGTCLLTTACVIISKDDISGFKLREVDEIKKCDGNGVTEVGSIYVERESNSVEEGCGERKPFSTQIGLDFAKGVELEHHCCTTHNIPELLPRGQAINGPVDLQADQLSFLNCYLGDAFLFRSSGLSKDIEWMDFGCPQCSSILGTYPCADGSEPLDSGIRLIKCYISISFPTDSSDDLFRKYTLERMFSSRLLESAKDELSFRTVVKDLKTKSPMLQIVLLNPNSWCSTGHCSENTAEKLLKINLHPVVKVLFSQCCNNVESELRINQEWETKNEADEIYMLSHLIRELIESMARAKDAFPPSFSSSQGFLLSSLIR